MLARRTCGQTDLVRLPAAPLLALTLLIPPAGAQQTVKPAVAAPADPATPDYSKEPFIVESLVTRARFENDGTGRVESTARIRVQNEAGAKAFSDLVFPYNSAAERIEIPYVRVRRADKTVTAAARESFRDVAAQVVRDAPAYTGPREKDVGLPALHPGDTIEYQSAGIIDRPLAPGQFWFEYQMEKNAITLEQKLQLDVPAGRAVKLKTLPGFEPAEAKTSEESGRRVYRWNASNTARGKARSGQSDEPDIAVSTFGSWEEVGAWYQVLERDRAGVAAEIQKKADELTQGRVTPMEKLEALYDYVSTNFRYIDLPFGSGEVAPRTGAAVLKIDYADSKDKHALLAALAAAEGIHAEAVLAHAQRDLDADMPSPASVNHVLTRFQIGSDEIWLDTSTEVAPFRFLPSPLRHRRALAVPADGSAVLVETPADPPFAVRQLWRIEGFVNDIGKLDAHVHYELSGDNELLLRQAFRRSPEKDWKKLGEAIAASDGLRGAVSEVNPSDPADTHHRFTLDYHVVQPAFLDWTKRRVDFLAPLPPLALPEPATEAATGADSISLGSPAEVALEMKLFMPVRYVAHVPAAVAVGRDYGEYRSVYAVAGHVLSASRTLNIRRRELPADRAKDYALFFRPAVRNDEAQTFLLEAAETGAPAVPETASADDLVVAATRAYSSQQFPLAERLLERVVTLDPRHKHAWKLLGAVRLAQQENAQAAEAFRKQIELEPGDEFAYEGLGLAQAAQRQYDDAIASFRKQLEVKPLDPIAQASLGTTLAEARRFSEAAKELEKAVALSPEDPRLYVSLGGTELNLEHTEKATAAFDKAVELSPSPPIWNGAAAELARHGVNLERAQQFAESSVASTATELRSASLEAITPRDLSRVTTLGACWDTLGWVWFHRGDAKRAERYVEAAWQLNFGGETGDHLAQIYEKQGQTEEAKRTYALALATGHAPAETRGRFEKLLGDAQQADGLVAAARDELPRLRQFNVARPLPKEGSGAADFFVLLVPGSRGAEAVKFIHGDASFREAAERLRGLNYGRMFPDDSAVKIVRRGTLTCAEVKQPCIFTLLPVAEVRSVE